jgi:hypothetical protein
VAHRGTLAFRRHDRYLAHRVEGRRERDEARRVYAVVVGY